MSCYILLCLLCGATCSGPASADQPPTVRVLTYNVHHGKGTDGQLNLKRIAAVIQSAQADVVVLQEVDQKVSRSGNVDQAQRLAELTGMAWAFGDNIELQGGRYGNAVLTKLPLLHAENHPLPRHQAGEQRGALLVELRLGRDVVRLLATHFDHRPDDTERMASVRWINRLALQTPQTPALLVGDLNATRDSRVVSLLTAAAPNSAVPNNAAPNSAVPNNAVPSSAAAATGRDLRAAWTIAGTEEQPTSPATAPQRQIDFVLYRPGHRWETIATTVLDEPTASDHRPLAAELRLLADPNSIMEDRNILATVGADGRASIARDPAQWQPRRDSIRRAMQSVIGDLPPPASRRPPAMTVLESVDCGTYTRQRITYQSQPGAATPAYLCIPHSPATGQTFPAMLCLHPTDDQIGHGVVVGLSDKPNRSYAAELAERGYVTLAPSYPLLANYQPNLEQLGWESGTAKAIWDNMRGIDLLQQLPQVNPQAIGAIGHSLGGHNSIYTAVFDERIQVVVSSCGFDSYQDYYDGDPQVWQPGKGWTQLRYMPRLADYQGRLAEIPFDFDELLAVLAPRPMLAVAPRGDSNFRFASVDRVTATARKVYQLHGAADQLQVRHPDCDHDFPTPLRHEAYELLDRVLKQPANGS